jgi:MOSC domain-containing protein YiiM
VARIVTVNVVHALVPDTVGDLELTAIDKRPRHGHVRVFALGIDGDTQFDTRHHGGLDQAVYAYAQEDYRWWSAELGRELTPGMFGENLTTEGLDVTGAVLGERWAVGSVVLVVRSPRIPCRTFAGWLDEPQWVKRFTDHGAPGAYLSVVTEGAVAAGDPVALVHRPDHGATVGDLFAVRSGDRDPGRLARLQSAAVDLVPEDRERLARITAAPGSPTDEGHA